MSDLPLAFSAKRQYRLIVDTRNDITLRAIKLLEAKRVADPSNPYLAGAILSLRAKIIR